MIDCARRRATNKRWRLARQATGLCLDCDTAATHGDYCDGCHARRTAWRHAHDPTCRPGVRGRRPTARADGWAREHAQGRSVVAIAMAAGVSRHTVRDALIRRGVYAPRCVDRARKGGD